MKNVLITGSAGFVGKNLIASLAHRQDLQIKEYDRDDNPNTLSTLVKEADFIFHLAGVNRPLNVEEFNQGNVELTELLTSLLSEHNAKSKKSIPLLISSSAQAMMDNPYGLSKRKAEEVVFAYSRQTNAPVYVYRLPNVFGKWCRPNYNSVVATFCHNIARDLPIQVNDPTVVMNLVYIDDVINEFISALDNKQHQHIGDTFHQVKPAYTITLGEIATLIQSFKNSREDRNIPDMSDLFIKKLYSTYLSYLPTNQFSYPLKMNIDERGSFTEFIKSITGGQVSINVSKPGITRGNHWHHTKNEKFLVVSGQGTIKFKIVGGSEIIEYPVSGDTLIVIDIPPGHTHSITNIGDTDLITVMWANESFNPEKPDTYFLPVISNH